MFCTQARFDQTRLSLKNFYDFGGFTVLISVKTVMRRVSREVRLRELHLVRRSTEGAVEDGL